jgi:CheY-like chemotaxis protein
MSVFKPAILVVEDEFLLREAAIALVEDAGFEALAAVSADEALAILETRAEEVRLVFTDIQIAGSMDRAQAGARGSRTLATRRADPDLGSAPYPTGRPARSRTVFCQALRL